MRDEVIYGINGPVVTVRNSKSFSMSEMVYIGPDRLIGEVIKIDSERTTIQSYEETSGLSPGDKVVGSGSAMSLLLGPGIIGNIFDGVQRPLNSIEKSAGSFIPKGCSVSPLDDSKVWDIDITVKMGQNLSEGQIYAVCMETQSIEHRFMVPIGVNGKVIEVKPSGKYQINDVVAKLETENGVFDLSLCQKWPIRIPRKVAKRLPIDIPLVTGQRVIDSIFPIAKGGAAVLPGGFGAGKTMTQHQFAKWCDADIIVYVGCGERGNEMTQVLEEFSSLVDPKTGKPMSERTIFIANTSNMPVAAREASIYTGITLAEYYRDMGYDVAMMADSTSRWAEALREISGRLEEMPAEEGFPSYLVSRLSEFYERAGRCSTLSGSTGSVTIIGAVSPQGADFSEPVTQNTKRFTRCFWALDKNLAYARHYPAVNWNMSYSEYFSDLDPWYAKNVGPDFTKLRKQIVKILREEERLMEIVKLVGEDVLPDDQKLSIETAKLVRFGFLQQNAFHKEDTFVPLIKQQEMMRVIIYLHEKVRNLISASVPMAKVMELGLFSDLAKMKYEIPNDNIEKFNDYISKIDNQIKKLIS
jgi:V/A-type H+-transporting ATPase subunit A